ncbi:exocyst complex component Sec10-domain-containing protein [Daedaleopsis nitida]|nr:exocyst complex component Sec10-domain-containing protein [Daedaleopsis nitida]
MDKFATLEPVRLYNNTPGVLSTSSSNRFSLTKPAGLPFSSHSSHSRTKSYAPFQLVGRLPVDLHIYILTLLAVPDIPAYARCSRALGNLAKDERVWEARWKAFGVDIHQLGDVLDTLEEKVKVQNGLDQNHAPPTLATESLDDDFGDFTSTSNNAQPGEMGDFVGAFSLSTPRTAHGFPIPSSSKTSRALYIRAHTLLKPLVSALSSPPHAVLSIIFPSPAPSLRHQAHTLRLLSLFLSSRVRPLRTWETLSAALRAAIDRFEDSLLTAFDVADGKGDERGMAEAAEASWEVWDGSGGEWELRRVWAEKREIFYEQSKWKPLDNFTNDSQLDFTPMDEFIVEILAALQEHGSRAVRVFPPASNVLLSFADRLANEVVGEYIASLLTRAREISNETFLKATAASFKEAWRMVDTIVQVGASRTDLDLPKTKAEDVVYRMFESNMDEYLDEEVEFVKQCFEMTCRSWEKRLSEHKATVGNLANPEHARFLGSHNPAQVKRTVLASFTNVLLLPVTIVPRTVGKAVGAAITTGSSAAVQGIQMLNPQRWGATPTTGQGAFPFARMPSWNANGRDGYVRDFEKGGDGMLFDIGGDDDEEDAEVTKEKTPSEKTARSSMTVSTITEESSSTAPTSIHSTRVSTPVPPALENFDLLLSLDIALELIHADRDSLKRAETFSGYPGSYGHRVRDTIEEIFVLLLQALSERHIKPGFETATERMRSYKPAEHEETKSVAPLLQFFELVHVGDTMQSMVQVYFDKELAPHIDRHDFLNAVVREKKHFEDVLDNSVAAGLNAATDALMNQVEHIIQKLTKPREYYPPEDGPMELGPTEGCREAIKCLQMHCQLVKGSTSKEVLEVFYQEVGFRLIAILQKHIKRQIISLNGGFQIIADLNAYHTFISSLRVATVTSDFAYLKMLGHVYVVEDAKDLAQIVRDVTRYGGAYRPEDIYEFIQRRSDWKKIEKTVDKTMYNLSFKEDCTLC